MKDVDYEKYDGMDTVILDKHAADTIKEDCQSFQCQLENHCAHVIMLMEQGIITKEEAGKILGALLRLLDIGPENIPFRPGLTDLYSNIEEWLIDELGIETGGKVHTGRSRNDMNSSVERVYTRRTMLDVLEAMLLLMKTLLNMAEEHKDTVIPGYTHHSQQAQPVTLGHFYTSAFQAFSRDAERLLEAYKRVNLSTMGGAAIATTSFPISRERTSELLGFDGYLLNSMDATAALDFAYEPASVMAIFINNVGRVIESMLLWNLNEVGISRLALKYCSYSTIMPQKRNPVSLETLRYSGEWTYGALSTMFNTMKAYPQGNGREPGFVVSLYYEIAEKIKESAYLLEGIVRTLEVDKDRGLEVTKYGFCTVTDLADEMVKSLGLSFSAAKKIVGKLVTIAHDENISIDQVDSKLVARAAKESLGMELEMDDTLIRHALDPWENVSRRDIPGGPSPERVQDMIDQGWKKIEEISAGWQEKVQADKDASQHLMALAKSIAAQV